MAQSGSKGSISNPYTMSEFESMADAGTWQGGYVMDDNGNVTYMMKEVTVDGYSCGSYTSGSGSGDFQFASYTSFSGDSSSGDDDDDDGYGNGGNGGNGGSGGGTGRGTGGGTGGSGNAGITGENFGFGNGVPDVSNKVTFSGFRKNDPKGCLSRCTEMLQSAGGELTGEDIAMGIYQDERVVGPVENYADGIQYIEEQLNNGLPVIVYVDYKDGCSVGKTKNDKAGDHAIIIVGGSCDCGFHFYDPATGNEGRGTSTSNRLIYQDGMLQCDCTCTGNSKHYILSSIRINI